jgi:ribose transport system permease protein
VTGAEAAMMADRDGPRRGAEALPFVVLAVAVAIVAVLAVALTPNFLTLDNLTAIMRNAAVVGIAAVAMTPVTLSGNFVSLATSESAMLAMVLFVALVGLGWPQPLVVLAVVVVLAAAGVLQGALVAAGLNPIITTLAAGAIIFGVVSQLTGGGIVRTGSGPIPWGLASVAGVPVQVVVFVVFTAVVTFVTERTLIGRQTVLVGANRRTAALSGISATRVTLVAFVILSVGLAICGILNGAAFGQATAVSFPGFAIDVIAALLVGGTAIQGGRGSPLQSALGAVLIAVVGNMMILNDFSTGGRLAVQGSVVVAIVVFLEVVRRRRGGRA